MYDEELDNEILYLEQVRTMFKDEKTQQFKELMTARRELHSKFPNWWYWGPEPTEELNSTRPAPEGISAPECTSSCTNDDSGSWDTSKWPWEKARMALHPEQLKALQRDNLDLHLSGPMKTSRAKPKPRWRPTRRTTSKTTNTSNLSVHIPLQLSESALIAAEKAFKSSTFNRTKESVRTADESTASTASSLSLTQWFDTVMGPSGRSTPRPNPSRATTIGKIGPLGLKRKFICGHLATCTRTKECRALYSTWFRGGALRPGADLSSIASMILDSHRRLSRSSSET